MAVPDWPNTYGYNLFLFPVSQWVGGILYEHTHRLVAAGVGLLTAMLAAWLWVRETRGWRRWLGCGAMGLAVGLLGARQMSVYVTLAAIAVPVIGWTLVRFGRAPDELRWLGVAALAGVILQGVLGGLRVAWLADGIGVFHGMLAQSFLVLVVLLAVMTSRRWTTGSDLHVPASMGRMVLAATLLIFAQLGLGASMRHRHAGLAVPDFPLAHGQLWPRTDAEAIARYNQQRVEVHAAHALTATDVVLHMTHRLGACAVLAAVGMAWSRARRALPARHPVRRGTLAWLVLVAAQFGLGAVTVWTNKAADVATTHVAVGSLALAIGGVLSLLSFRRMLLQPGPATGPPPTALSSARLRNGIA